MLQEFDSTDNKMDSIVFEIDEDTYNLLESEAEERGLTINEVIVEAIAYYANKYHAMQYNQHNQLEF